MFSLQKNHTQNQQQIKSSCVLAAMVLLYQLNIYY